MGPGKKVLEQIRQAQQNRLASETIESLQQQYLSFRLNDDWYGLVVFCLVEVLPLQKITRVPSVPDYVLGVMNFRGEVLSAIDLKRFFGLPQDSTSEEQNIVVVEHGQVRTGFLVDEIGDLISLTPEELLEEPLLVGKAQRNFFEGAVRWGEALLTVINLEGLLHADGLYYPQD
jgi:purine-binding chemotaxis protein CheW